MNLYEFATQPEPIDMSPDTSYLNTKAARHIIHADCTNKLQWETFFQTFTRGLDEPFASYGVTEALRKNLVTETEFRMYCLFVHWATLEE